MGDALPKFSKMTQKLEVETERYKVESVHYALVLVRSFNRAVTEIPVSDVERLLSISPSRAEKVIQTLIDGGLLVRDEGTDMLRLGWEWIRLSHLRKGQMTIREFALPIMREIQVMTGETVVLNIQVGWRRVSLEFVESAHSLERVIQPGYDAPLYAGAASRVLLAGLGKSELRHYLTQTPLVALASGTITDRKVLIESLEDIRTSGHALSHSEVNAGISAAAAPVFDHTHKIVASLTVSYPTRRRTDELERRILDCVRDGASHMTRQLRVIR